MRVQDLEITPGLTALCAGYEQGRWRAQALAREMFDHLADFALSYSDRKTFTSSNAMARLRKGAQVVYNTDKYQKRGEFGELLLHVALTQFFNTEPAVSKLYYKDAQNDTVKGFDAVHVVADEDRLELWLGEVKFYASFSSAIRDVVRELHDHLRPSYLRNEFALISNKLDPNWPQYDRLKRVLHENESLDSIFDVVRVPVLLTYDSEVVQRNNSDKHPYGRDFEAEARSCWERFTSRELPASVELTLILMPLGTKSVLVEQLHRRLEQWQEN